jgi:hypothetical protein
MPVEHYSAEEIGVALADQMDPLGVAFIQEDNVFRVSGFESQRHATAFLKIFMIDCLGYSPVNDEMVSVHQAGDGTYDINFVYDQNDEAKKLWKGFMDKCQEVPPASLLDDSSSTSPDYSLENLLRTTFL